MNNNELINRLKVFYNTSLDMRLCRSEFDGNKEMEQTLRELKDDFNRLFLGLLEDEGINTNEFNR